MSSLEGHLHKLHNTFVDGDRVGLEEEFKVQREVQISLVTFPKTILNPFVRACLIIAQKLTNMRIMKENMRTGNLPANMKKNRVLQIIPCKNGAGV